MKRSPKGLKIVFTSKNLTHFGGLYLLQRFFQRLNLRSLLNQHVRFLQRNNRCSIAEEILAIPYPIMKKVKLHLEEAEEKALDHMVELGLFTNRDEAARAAILKYAMDIGAQGRQSIWREMRRIKKRKITPEQLAKDLETLEDETYESVHRKQQGVFKYFFVYLY